MNWDQRTLTQTAMMMRVAFGLCLVVIGTSAFARWSDELPLDAYIDPVDREIARTGKAVSGRPVPCGRDEIHNGVPVIAAVPTDQCVKMTESQRFVGLWRNDFEGSRFCPEPATECQFDTPGEKIWLNPEYGRPDGRLYRVDFIGRQTIHKGPYGHLGSADHEIMVDRWASKVAVAGPAPLDKETARSMRKQCKKVPACRYDGMTMKALDEYLRE